MIKEKKNGSGQKHPTARKTLPRLCGYILRNWYFLFPAVLFTLLSNLLSLLIPKYSGVAIDAIAAKNGVDSAALKSSLGRMLVCCLVSALLAYLLELLMKRMSQNIVCTMRQQVFDRLTVLPVGYFDTHASGDIISRISYDIDTVNASLSEDFVQIMTSCYTVIGSVFFMLRISKPLLLVFLITVPIAVLFTRYRAAYIRPLFRNRSEKLGELNGYAEEMLSGCRTISAYHREDVISERFNRRSTEAMDAYYRAEYYGCTMGPTVTLINNLSISLVMILGGIFYLMSENGTFGAGSLFFLSLGGVAQFIQYARKLADPINEFANILSELQSSMSAAERIFSILDESPEAQDAPDAEEVKEVSGCVAFRDLSFGYTKEKTVLRNINFRTEPGKTAAFVGPTGAGKTTLISLLMRFYDPESGGITLDGKPYEDLTRSSLRQAYTMVLQDTWLFGGTIYENIAYGCEHPTPEAVKRAAQAAQIDFFIESLPNGYQTVLNDAAVNISKGQMQLITIARALLSDSKMLILDEATSNVDSRTEIQIQKAMTELMRGRTCFVIAHRLSTVRNADCIYVIRNGTITESGTHDELMRAGGFYQSLYQSQFS